MTWQIWSLNRKLIADGLILPSLYLTKEFWLVIGSKNNFMKKVNFCIPPAEIFIGN